MNTEEKIDGLADGSWKIQLENDEKISICKRLRASEKERDQLRQRIEAADKQEPVAYLHTDQWGFTELCTEDDKGAEPLYALPPTTNKMSDEITDDFTLKRIMKMFDDMGIDTNNDIHKQLTSKILDGSIPTLTEDKKE